MILYIVTTHLLFCCYQLFCPFIFLILLILLLNIILTSFVPAYVVFQSRREYEQQVADEEAQQLRSFQVYFKFLLQFVTILRHLNKYDIGYDCCIFLEFN